ncbi:MAG: methyltransferase [Firmicutes bacterium]|nr:methyltransferase [Bacillota bacterium]
MCDSSRHELPRTTRYLFEALNHYEDAGKALKLLDVGSAQGVIAKSWAYGSRSAVYSHYLLPACQTVVDDYSLKAVSKRANTNWNDPYLVWGQKAQDLRVVFTDTCPSGTHDLAVFDTKDYETPHALEMITHLANCLALDGSLLSVIDDAVSTGNWLDELGASFSCVRELRSDSYGQGIRVFLATGPKTDRTRKWSCENWKLPFAGRTFTLCGAGGVFSPKGLDEGTGHMLKVIQETASLNEKRVRFLDLGCGTGAVSVVADQVFGCQVTAVDINARALYLTEKNCRANDVSSVLVLPSDGFDDISHLAPFDIIACNPPYHTDFGVAKKFVEGAFRYLDKKGCLYLVVKRTNWYEAKLRSIFGGFRRFVRGGYTVLVSEKRSSPSQSGAKPHKRSTKPAKRKHSKRLEASRLRKARRK